MMSDDWKPGDLALCVKSDGWETYEDRGFGDPESDPQRGCIYEVVEIEPCEIERVCLGFVEFPKSIYAARGFRKIHPLTDEEREEALRDLNTPVREPVQ